MTFSLSIVEHRHKQCWTLLRDHPFNSKPLMTFPSGRQSVSVCTNTENLEILLWKRHCVWRAKVVFQKTVFYCLELKVALWSCTCAVCSVRSPPGAVSTFQSGCEGDHLPSPILFVTNMISPSCASRHGVLSHRLTEAGRSLYFSLPETELTPLKMLKISFWHPQSERERRSEGGEVYTGIFFTLSLPEELKHNLSGHY